MSKEVCQTVRAFIDFVNTRTSVDEVPEGLLVELFREASVSEEDESDQLQWNSENNTRIVLSFLQFLDTVESSCQFAKSGLEYVFGLAGSSRAGVKEIPNLFLDWNAGLVSANGRTTVIQSLSKAMDVIRSVQVDVNRASRERAYNNAIKELAKASLTLIMAGRPFSEVGAPRDSVSCPPGRQEQTTGEEDPEGTAQPSSSTVPPASCPPVRQEQTTGEEDPEGTAQPSSSTVPPGAEPTA